MTANQTMRTPGNGSRKNQEENIAHNIVYRLTGEGEPHIMHHTREGTRKKLVVNPEDALESMIAWGVPDPGMLYQQYLMNPAPADDPESLNQIYQAVLEAIRQREDNVTLPSPEAKYQQ